MGGITKVTWVTIFSALLALFVLVAIFYPRLAGFFYTDEWEKTVDLFNKKLLYGSMLNPGIGNLDKFSVSLYLSEEALYKIYFIDRERSYECSKSCSKSGLDEEIIQACQTECIKKCGEEKGDCIVLLPKKAEWKGAKGWFMTKNKPVIYSSGKFILNFPSEWEGIDKGITPKDDVKCIVFTRVDQTHYDVTVADKEVDCDEEEGRG